MLTIRGPNLDGRDVDNYEEFVFTFSPVSAYIGFLGVLRYAIGLEPLVMASSLMTIN